MTSTEEEEMWFLQKLKHEQQKIHRKRHHYILPVLTNGGSKGFAVHEHHSNDSLSPEIMPKEKNTQGLA